MTPEEALDLPAAREIQRMHTQDEAAAKGMWLLEQIFGPKPQVEGPGDEEAG